MCTRRTASKLPYRRTVRTYRRSQCSGKKELLLVTFPIWKDGLSSNMPADAVLVISYIGYITQEVSLKAHQTSIKITLVQNSQALDEVVVTGYSTQVKKI